MRASSVNTLTLAIQGHDVPTHLVNTAIIGAGASGMGCACRLWEFHRQQGIEKPEQFIAVVTGGVGLGASRMSGSDKQTYYKMGTSPRVSDSARSFAEALTAGGCMHGDLALAEGLSSLRGFYGLTDAGVPFPHDPWGAFIGYKTDHDPYERATSAGPKTSRFMSECLQAKAEHFGIPILDKLEVIHFITQGEGDARRIAAIVCLDKRRTADASCGLSLIVANQFVLAAGGPGQIYRDTVYPKGQVGIHGLAFKAGLKMVNATESQYGLASIKFRWNVSGTYMQVVPRIFSTDANGGDEREFLTEYFDDMGTMATDIFLKGYQWPFDAQRIAGQQSSLVDMAVHQETVVRGRRVYMDFLKNPIGKPDWEPFTFDCLHEEAHSYLKATGAMQALPIDRLRHMNTPAIEIYAEHDIDLATEPLEIAVCAQHQNGGFEVDAWWRGTLPGVFVIGEMAGTHGVKRPGGSALNAGQVGALRAAEYIANVHEAKDPDWPALEQLVTGEAAAALKTLGLKLDASNPARPTPGDVMRQIGDLMTRHAAHLRDEPGVRQAKRQLLELLGSIETDGLHIATRKQLINALQAQHQCLTAIALLRGIEEMYRRGGGSRGSHCMLAPDGQVMDDRLIDPDTNRPYAARPENEALRKTVLRLAYARDASDRFAADEVAVRPVPDRDIAFEPAWTEYRQKRIFDAI